MEIVGGKVLVDNFGGIFLVERFIHFEDSTQTFQGLYRNGKHFQNSV